jgi:hypothetical protein
MVTIVKGNEKIICTKGTFKEQYRPLGYRLASENKKEATKKVASSFEEKEELEIKTDDAEEEKEELSAKYGLKSKKSTANKKEDK